MLYHLLKIPARLAFRIYVRNLRLKNPEALNMKGPLLIAANHPNSFLDAIIIATLFRKPVYSLARGDAFSNRLTSTLLRALNILPVYRLREGAENLSQNYSTFEACREIFRKNGIVLIFSEGLCINEWKLRPLMKGTARLAISSWEEGIPLTILPAAINYHSFTRFGKHVHLHFGKAFTQTDLEDTNGYGKTILSFNRRLDSELKQLVIEIDGSDHESIRRVFASEKPGWQTSLLTIPAIVGWLLHAPLYYPLKKIVYRKALHSGHYDSIMVGALFILYPVYLLSAALITHAVCGTALAAGVLMCMPLLAYAFVQWKERY